MHQVEDKIQTLLFFHVSVNEDDFSLIIWEYGLKAA
jgi:hypothetical protein